ncbi:MAG TPA: sugar phosphate isomerase/epimerase family protein [Pirellulales bacterium]|jgi:sugar phosphate isomerase/epimerase|nr:sugar phosphate isomerase/epimerase family protein [Pirellulales bacterium]
MKSLDRRSFFRTSAALGLAAAGNSLPRVARAIEPIARLKQPKFEFSLAAYSYRGLLAGKTVQLTLEDFIRDCARMGLDATELTSYYFAPDVSPAQLRAIKRLAFCEGLDISGTAIRNEFSLPPGKQRDEQIAHVKHWIDNAAVLGAPVIRIYSGKVQKGQTEADARKLAIEGIEECCQYAGEHGVYLALENHGGLTTTIDGILQLVEAVKSPWFAVNLDTGNFHSSNPYDDIARLAPYAVNVQVKVMMHPEGGGKEPADFSRLAKILKEAGYRGYIVLEYEEAEDPRVACPRFVEQLRAAFA